jgi:acyl-CoA synthetase (AMP-forming)/AMP-acid ligase II
MLVVSGLLDTTDLSALRTIAYGTEPMPEGLLRRLGEKLPGVSFVQTYGMTELGVLPSESKNRDSLFLRFKGGDFETKVKDGTLWVRAQGAMIGYLNAPDQFDEDGFFNTFDVVEVDGDYLRILGRRSDMINVGGQKVFPTEVEDRLLELENVAEVVVYGKANPLMGQMVAAKIRLEKDEEEAAFKRRMHAFCRTCLAPYQIPRFVELCGEGLTNERLKKVRREK